MKRLVLAALLSLMLVAPAFALNYTGEAILHWDSLTWSRPIEYSVGSRQHGTAHLLYDSTGYGCCSGFIGGGWPDETLVTPWPEAGKVGTITTRADPSQLLASVNMVGEGFAVAELSRISDFQALESGLLTVSIDYSLTHVGVPALSGAFQSDAFASLSLSDQKNDAADTGQHFDALFGSGVQTGTLSLSRAFQAGEWGYFSTAGSVITTNLPVQSVPIPDMLWPTALGVVGLAGLVAWRQRGMAH